jgi:hypothetical protein
MSDGSSPARTPRKLRSPTDTESPVFVPSPRSLEDDTDSNSDMHQTPDDEEGYELQPMKAKGGTDDEDDEDNEGEKLLGGGEEEEEDYAGEDEVLYAVDEPDDVVLGSPVRPRRRRREFLYTRAEERAVVRKLDKYLVGGLAVLYMLR